MKQLFAPFGDRHFKPEEKETVKQKIIDPDQSKRTVEG